MLTVVTDEDTLDESPPSSSGSPSASEQCLSATLKRMPAVIRDYAAVNSGRSFQHSGLAGGMNVLGMGVASLAYSSPVPSTGITQSIKAISIVTTRRLYGWRQY